MLLREVSSQVNFPELEKRVAAFWREKDVLRKYLERNKGAARRFSFLDGPITANNPMGVHHGWGRTLKDLYQRYKNLQGCRERFQNGFDCQGLWIEVEVEKELGFKSKKDIEKYGVAAFVEKCKERVRKYAAIQSEQSQRLGYFMDWDNSYYTMSDENNYTIWFFLKTCHERGWLYKGRDSVPWCPRCETAISQHEMLTEDYKEITHESVILEYPLVGREKEFLLVWTTTPWTIPANVAVAVDENQNYSLVQGNDANKFWLAEKLVERIFAGSRPAVLKTVKGKELLGLKYAGPFDDLPAVAKVARENPQTFHTVIPTDDRLMPISLEEGTGLVHTAVSAGQEDFQLGKKLGLPLIPVIADNADFLEGFGQFSRQNAKNNPRLILDFLEAREKSGQDTVFQIFPYAHRYPACWRCKTELVWKVADEWYLAMDQVDPTDVKKRTLRQEMIEVAQQIQWRPAFGLERELDWLKNMHDWLISKKNRYWGLALPIFECEKCGHFEVIGSKEELRVRAAEGWEKFALHSPHRPWVDEVRIRCSQCGSRVSRIKDVGNPWLDAGIVSFSTLIDPATQELSYTGDQKYWREWFPADFITESFPGQFKNWFYSLIAMATVLEKTAPFKTVLGFATLFGEDGRPMHKSWGNAIEFNEGAEKMGADLMRWMYGRQEVSSNLNFGYGPAEKIKKEFFLIFWNCYKFFVDYARADQINLENIGSVETENLSLLDKWILSRLNRLVDWVSASLDQYDHARAALAIESFVVNDFSTWYIRRSRSRVGPSVVSGTDKTSFYQTSHWVLTALLRLLAPFTPFLTEEIHQNLVSPAQKESVHLEDWPRVYPEFLDDRLEAGMETTRRLVSRSLAERKKLGLKVRQPLAGLTIDQDLAPEFLNLLKDEVNVKEVKRGEVLALDTVLTSELQEEGLVRDFIRSVQNQRKALGLKAPDRIRITAGGQDEIGRVLQKHRATILQETLAENLDFRPAEKDLLEVTPVK